MSPAGDGIAAVADPALEAPSRDELGQKMADEQQQGFDLMQQNNPAEGYKKFQESARYARELQRRFPDLSPQEKATLGNVFYNDACSLAVEGNSSAALAALKEAMNAGFADTKQLDSDADLATVRALPEFAAWRKGLDDLVAAPAQEVARSQIPALNPSPAVQPGGLVVPAPVAGSSAHAESTNGIPPESLPPDPRTLAKIAKKFAETPMRPLPKDADTSHSLRRWQVRTDFWREVFLDGFRTRKSGDASQTAEAEIFLEGYCLHIGDSPDAPSTSDLLKQGEQLYEANVRDPSVSLALAGVLVDTQEGGSPRLTEVFKSLEETFESGQYSPWLAARFHLLRAMSPINKDGGARREQMQFMVDDLLRAASDPGLTNIRRRMLAHLFDSWGAKFPTGEFRVALTMKLDSAKDLDPWVRAILLTRLYSAVAWKARGGGTAVTQDGWQRFLHNMEHARRHALRAWELKPELPEAAGAMLKITMASKGAAAENVRFWFDEAVQADFTYLDAYYNLAWALRPRWGGNHNQMFAFGNECLSTGRFDTDVPFMYHHVVSDIVDERGDWKAMLQISGVYERYNLLFETLAQNAKDDTARNRHRSRLAAVSYVAGKNDKVREILSELKEAARSQDFELFNLSLDEVRKEIESK